MKISRGKRVRLKTKLSIVGGELLEQKVVEYFAGSGTMLPGLDKVLDGLQAGDKREGVIEATEAFGSPQHRPAKSIPRKEFPADAQLEKGTEFAATAEGGQNVILQVQRVDDEKVDVVMLHPLHNKDIAYELEVLKVTDPSPPPLPADAVAGEDD